MKPEEARFFDKEKVFKADIEGLCRLFVVSTESKRNALTANLDLFYLLLNRDDEKLYNLLRKEFLEGKP